MEIIHRGKIPGNRLHTATCKSCGTLFRFAESEAVTVHDQRDGDHLSILCPLDGCGTTVRVAKTGPQR